MTCGTQIDLLQNFTGDFGINERIGINGRGYHVWIIAGPNIYSLPQENSSTVNTIYAITVNFSSTDALSCGEEYLYVYKESNVSTQLTAIFTGTDLQSGSVLIQSSIITVVYHYDVGQSDGIGFNATYTIKPLFNTTAMVRPSNSILFLF